MNSQQTAVAAPSSGSARAYARHRAGRGLSGATHRSVAKAISSGRIAKAVRTVGRTTVIDFEHADVEWAKNSDQTKLRQLAEPPKTPAAVEDEPSWLIDVTRFSVVGGSAYGASVAHDHVLLAVDERHLYPTSAETAAVLAMHLLQAADELLPGVCDAVVEALERRAGR